MKRALTAALLLIGAAAAATRIYDVRPYRNSNGWTPMWGDVTQAFVNTADSLVWAEFFVGAPDTGGTYVFDILDAETNQPAYHGTKSISGQGYDYVRSDLLERQAPVVKGRAYKLKITHSGGDSINFYHDPTNPYQYGGITSPSGLAGSDLACRIEGITYIDPEFVGTWDVIPMHIVDTVWLSWFRHGDSVHPGSRSVEIQKLAAAAPVMEGLGIRAQRIVDNWYFAQPDSHNVDSFDWGCGNDTAWSILARHGIRPHLVSSGNGHWPLWERHYRNSVSERQVMMPTNLFDSIWDPDTSQGQRIYRKNHLAWFYYNYVKRYGPIGTSGSGEATGTFWTERTGSSGLHYLPLLRIECCNEPTYTAGESAWQYGPIYDSVVHEIRDSLGLFDDRVRAFTRVYSRYCAVMDTAVKFASESIQTEMYCPNGISGEPMPIADWLDSMASQGVPSQVVSFHSHIHPVSKELHIRGEFRGHVTKMIARCCCAAESH